MIWSHGWCSSLWNTPWGLMRSASVRHEVAQKLTASRPSFVQHLSRWSVCPQVWKRLTLHMITRPPLTKNYQAEKTRPPWQSQEHWDMFRVHLVLRGPGRLQSGCGVCGVESYSRNLRWTEKIGTSQTGGKLNWFGLKKSNVVSFSAPNQIGIFERNQAAWGFLSSNAGNTNEQFFVGFWKTNTNTESWPSTWIWSAKQGEGWIENDSVNSATWGTLSNKVCQTYRNFIEP